MKTYMANESTIERKWYLVDAKGKTLGRLASEIAKILMGKNKPEYTPHVDTGDFVVVINADKIYLSGKKLDQKIYRKHSGHPGGMKEIKYGELIEEKPEFAFKLAVKRMLPKTSLGRKMAKKLYVYAGSEQPHAAQKPEKVELV